MYPIAGFAPGNYSGICYACNAEFTGDKRAITCESCALEMLLMGAEAYARTMHEGQLYGEEPYVDGHVVKVVEVLKDFGFGERYQAAGFLHDVIEDTVASKSDVERHCGEFVAELVWACTGIGPNRKARNLSIYEKIAAFPEAAIVKVADRIANVEATDPQSGHRSMYCKEAETFYELVALHVPQPMRDRLAAAYVAN